MIQPVNLLEKQSSKQKKNVIEDNLDYSFDADVDLIVNCENELLQEEAIRRFQKNQKIILQNLKEVQKLFQELIMKKFSPSQIEQEFLWVLSLFELFKKAQVTLIYYDIIMESFLRHTEEEIKCILCIAIENWKKIPALCLDKFLKQIPIADKIDPKEIENQINNLMLVKKVQEAIKIFNLFGMRKHMNMFDLIERTVNQERIQDAIMLIQPEEIEYQKFLISMLIEKSYIDRCVDLINDYNLNPFDFPELIHKMEKKSIQKIVTSINDWEKAEERVIEHKQMLKFCIQALHEQKGYQQAFSVASRHKLLADPYFSDNNITFKVYEEVLNNRLLIRDGWGPTEVECFDEKVENYLHLSEYKIDEKDVKFIDSVDEQFVNAKGKILKSSIIGFDSEFAQSWNKFQDGGIALLQLATKDEIYLFDALRLLRLEESRNIFTEFCRELFEAPHILKIGHSISTDLSEMNKTFITEIPFKLNGFIDVALVNRDIFNLKNTASLKFMVQKLLNKNMSKYEQISNWNKRPLRRAQMHYAAIDAYIVIQIYDKLQEIQKAGGAISFVNLYESTADKEGKTIVNQIKQNLVIVEDSKITYTKETERFFRMEDTTNIKFLVDNMLFKLVKYLRNSGLDAAYIKDRDYQLLQDLSMREERIVITRDSKLFQMKKSIPVYLLQENLDTEQQFKEILNYFKIQENKLKLLSRCVKCNNDQIVVISSEEAARHLSFSNPQDYSKFEYWQCSQCKQVYWEGETFKKSQKRFEDLTQNK